MKLLLITLLLLLPITCFSKGLVDLSIVAKIESNNNIWAYNPKNNARGLYQITPICLEDYNNWNYKTLNNIYKEVEIEIRKWIIAILFTRITLDDLWKPEKNEKVARWYLEKRLPELLKHYKIKVTTKNILWAYNAGIGRVIKGVMPKETKKYIEKYFKEIIQ